MIELDQEISIPVDVGEGAFLGEYLVTIDTLEGPVSGFVSKSEIVTGDEGDAFITGRVVDVGEDHVSVMISGSFFTTTGITRFTKNWAEKRLKVA